MQIHQHAQRHTYIHAYIQSKGIKQRYFRGEKRGETDAYLFSLHLPLVTRVPMHTCLSNFTWDLWKPRTTNLLQGKGEKHDWMHTCFFYLPYLPSHLYLFIRGSFVNNFSLEFRAVNRINNEENVIAYTYVFTDSP